MPKIAVIIPCYNEEITVEKVVTDFQKELPEAEIYVFDNNSKDQTPALAKKAGALVIPSPRPGKGAVIRHSFRKIEADIYILVDGDDTYPAESVHALIREIENGADMVVGDRITNGEYHEENKRPFHSFGNQLVCKSINLLFKTDIKDTMSGYRAMTKQFVQNCPILVDGFEVETEMTLHAVEKLHRIKEVPIKYRDRPPGSHSKLNTIQDGINVIRSIIWVFKDSKPLIFFSILSLIQISIATLCIAYQLIVKSENPFLFPIGLAILVCSSVTLCSGFILDTLAKYHRENFECQYLKQIPKTKP